MKKKIFFAIFAMLLLAFIDSMNVCAINTGLTVEKTNLEEHKSFLETHEMELLDKETVKSPFDCYDVNENGLLAIGTEDTMDTICIYNLEGEFQYGFAFDCMSSFNIELDGDNIILYCVRSNVAAVYNKEGECIETAKIVNSFENNSYWNNIISSESRLVGDVVYNCKNDIGILNLFASSYSQIVATDKEGNERIIYDANDIQLTRSITWFILIVGFLIVVFGVALWKIKKMNKNQRLSSEKKNSLKID